MYRIWAITKLEFKRLTKSWLYLSCCLAIIVTPFIIDPPFIDGALRSVISAAYSFAYGVSLLASFLIPFIMTTLFYYDDKTKTVGVLFTQPITSRTYALGKFLGAFIAIVLIVLLSLVIHICIPIIAGQAPYLPGEFILAVLVYVVPTLFYFSAFCFLVLILLKIPLLTAILPLFYVIFSSAWGSVVDYLLRGRELSILLKGSSESIQSIFDLSNLATNRILVIVLGFVFLISSIFIYSPKQTLRR